MHFEPRRMKFYGTRDIDRIPELSRLTPEERFEMKVVSKVLPFRTNSYVVEELIDWNRVPRDPLFQLTFPQRGMLNDEYFDAVAGALKRKASKQELDHIIHEIRDRLNPHPAGQMTANVPMLNDEPVPGVQHKYRETALIFPSNGQTCHAYCTFCFRWPQFVGMSDLRFATDESARYQAYLKRHLEIRDVLVTGGDPMIMTAKQLGKYIEPLLGPGFEHIQRIRIGTKSVAYWPYRFVTDSDADEVLALFEKVVKAGKHLALMGHYNHWKELSTPVAREAVRRIRATGANIRTQSPIVRHVNDDPEVWATMAREQVQLGLIPYYMFIERNTGAKSHFEIPLARALAIYRQAFQQASGLGRTVRGPLMSALPGKIAVEGVSEIHGEKVFVLSFIQARNPDWFKRPFFAKYDSTATWLTDLEPAFGRKFFYEDDLDRILEHRRLGRTAWSGDWEEEPEEDEFPAFG